MKQQTVIPLLIAGTSSLTPGICKSTEEVVAETYDIDDEKELAQKTEMVKRKTGINTRYFSDQQDSCETLGTEALRMALENAQIAPEELERVIFVSSGAGDLLFPATANLICRGLGLKDSCDCFDVNNACTGFLTALDIARCSIATGSGPIAIVVVDLATRYTSPSDPRPYLVFGDAAAAAIIKPAQSGGILASFLRNDGITFGNVVLRTAAKAGTREAIRFTDTNVMIETQALEALDKCISVVLDRTSLTLEDMDWVLPHQPNGKLFDKIVEEFSIPLEKIVPVASEIGSTGAASLPFSLNRLLETRDVAPGHRILLAGVGGGIGYGATIYEVPQQ